MADTTVSSGDVDGVTIPPEGGSANPGKPPQKTGSAGGFDSRPESKIPAQVEETYKAQGQSDTGISYAGEQRKFLNWLNTQGLHFGTMPSGAVDKYLIENYPNPLTRNKWASALSTMIATARAMQIPFADQSISRYKREPKPKMIVAPPPSDRPFVLPGSPTMMAAPPQAQQYQHATPPSAAAIPMALPVEPPPPPSPNAIQKAAPSKPQQGAFPSLGARMKISRIADGTTPNVPPGYEIPINTYSKELIEMEGSIENFIMVRIRPYHGPYSGQPVAMYRVAMLDNSGKALPGHHWDIPIGADPNTFAPAGQQGGYGQQPQQQYPQQLPQQSSLVAAGNPSATMERLMERALEIAATERKEYEQKKKDLEEQRNKGQFSDTQFYMLMSQNPPPKPIDITALRRELREELNATQPAPVQSAPASAAQLNDLFGGPPKTDPLVEKLLANVESLNRQLIEMASKPAPAAPVVQNPIDQLTALATVMKALQPPPPPPNALMEQLAALALRQVTEPQKAKGIAEAIAEYKAIKELTGDTGEAGPTAGQTLVDAIHAVAENADKLGDMFAKLKGGAAKSAFQQARQQRAQLPAGQQEQTAPQSYMIAQKTQVAFAGMLKVVDDVKAPPEDVFVGVMGVLEALREEEDSRGKMITERTLELFNTANSRLDLQTMIVRFFGWCGASKINTEARTNRIASVMHTDYSTIYRMLNNGEEKVISDATPPKTEPVEAAPVTPVTEAPTTPPAAEQVVEAMTDDEESKDEEIEADDNDDTEGVEPVAINN